MSGRLFIAINFNDAVKEKMAALRDTIKKNARRCIITHTENIHLTLAFIGDCDAARTSVVKTILDNIRFKRFDLSMDGIGSFRKGGGDIWWVRASENDALSDIQRELTERLFSAGFDVDRRRYSPHVTLTREAVTDERPRSIQPIVQTVGSIELMKSERVDGKLTYTAIHSKSAEQ